MVDQGRQLRRLGPGGDQGALETGELAGGRLGGGEVGLDARIVATAIEIVE